MFFNANDGESGIIGYAITTESVEPQEFTACTATILLEIREETAWRTQDTIYYIWAKDVAGNVSNMNSIKTKKVPDLTPQNTTFTLDIPNGTWAQEKMLTVSTTVQGYTIELNPWLFYERTNVIKCGGSLMASNGKVTVKARLTDCYNNNGRRDNF